MPFTCQQLHGYLGHDGSIIGTIRTETLVEQTRSHLALRYDAGELADEWAPSDLQPGQALRKPRPLFKKLDEEIISQEVERMGT